MKYTYRLKKDCVQDEHGKDVCVWGIEVVARNGDVIACAQSVFCDKEMGEEFVTLCNSLKLDPLHLFDVLDDIL